MEGGTLVGWQREEVFASGGARRLLQEGGNSSAVAYRFQVKKEGSISVIGTVGYESCCT